MRYNPRCGSISLNLLGNHKRICGARSGTDGGLGEAFPPEFAGQIHALRIRHAAYHQRPPAHPHPISENSHALFDL